MLMGDVDGWWRGFLIRQEEGGAPTSPFLAFLLITPITILTIVIIIVHIWSQGGWVVRHLLTRGVDMKTLWIDWQCAVIKIYHGSNLYHTEFILKRSQIMSPGFHKRKDRAYHLGQMSENTWIISGIWSERSHDLAFDTLCGIPRQASCLLMFWLLMPPPPIPIWWITIYVAFNVWVFSSTEMSVNALSQFKFQDFLHRDGSHYKPTSSSSCWAKSPLIHP